MARSRNRPRVLFIDAYDSFTNNIVDLLETQLAVDVEVIRIDENLNCSNSKAEQHPNRNQERDRDRDNLAKLVQRFHAIVLGPGPGDPRKHEDIGLFRDIWELANSSPDELGHSLTSSYESFIRPVLGICLGFQSLVLSHGGSIRRRIDGPKHGIIQDLVHSNTDIFAGLPETISTVLYHSLEATLPQSKVNAKQECELEALAWDSVDGLVEDKYAKIGTAGPDEEGRPTILMAVKHTRLPYHGVQFHPESICSSAEIRQAIVNWWSTVVLWWHDRPGPSYQSPLKTSRNIGGQFDQHNKNISSYAENALPMPKTSVITETLPLSQLSIVEIVDLLQLDHDKFILLDTENHRRAETGRFSILGLQDEESLLIQTSRSGVVTSRSGKVVMEHQQRNEAGMDIISFLKHRLSKKQYCGGSEIVPFWGGFIGYLNYEYCLDALGVSCPAEDQNACPSASFVFVQRSVVIDHYEQQLYVQSIRPDDHSWVGETAISLRNHKKHEICAPFRHIAPDAKIELPDEQEYKNQIRAAKELIEAGESYELCLTSQARISTATAQNPWILYQRLRSLNPAPFSAYLHFDNLTLLSSSPERFLSWTRPCAIEAGGRLISKCQFRPIKGTVNRRPGPGKPPVTLQEAISILKSPKEMAENLMIADLIRHDLHGVVGSGNVKVTDLMAVEEYETVYQLVSVIEGDLYTCSIPDVGDASKESVKDKDKELPKTGIDVLAASLPPGSMTGAPKLRSCQILQGLEGRPRGIYSGVIGYMDVGGAGDFSVVIRSAVRDVYDKKSCQEGSQSDIWTIGAGGAITALSNEDDEYEEMMTKLRSTLRLFEQGH